MTQYKNILNQCLHPVAVPRITGTRIPIFRCGQCVNCLRQKANELAVRGMRQFFGQQVWFLTFTYKKESCPIMTTEYDVDTESGQILKERVSISRNPQFFEDSSYEWVYAPKVKRTIKRYSPLVVEEDLSATGYYNLKVSYPTVYYEDVKLLFKRFRQARPDALGDYLCVPEYGGVSYRPHYHLLVYGLSQSDIDYLVADWPYGSVDVRNLEDSVKEGEQLIDKVQKLSMYVAKYCTKGKFDCPYVKEKVCQKPRRAVSQNFGIGHDFEELKKSVLCTNELGITDPFFNDDLPIEFNEYQLSLLKSRRSYKVNGYPYPFPKYLLNKILKKTEKRVSPLFLRGLAKRNYDAYLKLQQLYGTEFIIPPDDKAKGIPKKYRVVSSTLSKEVARSILVDLIADTRRESLESARSFKDNSSYCAHCDSEEDALQFTSKALECQFISNIINNSIY